MATNQELLDKQNSGAVLSPLEHAQLNGNGVDFSSALQGYNPNPYTLATPPAAAPAPSKPVVTPAVTPSNTAANTGSGQSMANRYLSIQMVGGHAFDMSTPEGQIAHANALHAQNVEQNASAFNVFSQKQKDAIQSTAANYADSLASYKNTGNQISANALKYANNYALQGADLANSNGRNLAQIGATYSAASPLGFQSSQADDTGFANAQYQRGVQSLVNDRNATVGSNYINGVNDSGSLNLGTLGGTMGDSLNKNTADTANAGVRYDQFKNTQQNDLNNEVRSENFNLNAQQDQDANNTNRLNAYAGNKGVDFGLSNYKDTGPQSLDLSQYTSSPLTSSAAGAVQGANYNNYALPPGAANQTDQSQFLGYAPGTVQGGYLNKFFKATGPSS